MGPPVTCVYRLYDAGELVATGRMTLDELPETGQEVRLNGRTHIVREIAFGSDLPVLTLEPR
jgi:hypothetical protein